MRAGRIRPVAGVGGASPREPDDGAGRVHHVHRGRVSRLRVEVEELEALAGLLVDELRLPTPRFDWVGDEERIVAQLDGRVVADVEIRVPPGVGAVVNLIRAVGDAGVPPLDVVAVELAR